MSRRIVFNNVAEVVKLQRSNAVAEVVKLQRSALELPKHPGCSKQPGCCLTEKPARRKRHGFTLVELMVSIVLVVLLLLMYATVFEQAATVISTLRAVGKNDDRSRMLSIVIKDDLNRRTFNNVSPFLPGPTTKISDWDVRRGYFSISENDPTDNRDDVLSFTVRIDLFKPEENEALYLGKATFLKYAVLSSPPQPPYFVNQPEGDDGLPVAKDSDGDGILDTLVPENLNQIGASTAAEVVYFLRNGTLYRRILLVRDPYLSSTLDPPMIDGDFFGTDLIGIDLDTSVPFDPVRDAYLKKGSFWSHFDYSAHFNRFVKKTDPVTGAQTPNPEIRFHGTGNSTTNFLDNQSPTPFIINAAAVDPAARELPYSLGNPYLRFGNSLSNMDENIRDGSNSDPRPREFDSAGKFIGRFTMQETSHSAFGSPGLIPVAGDPFAFTTPLNLNNNGVVSAYSTEPLDRRRGEEILLNHVHSFDIKVWDDGLATPGWVDLGHNLGTVLKPGHYSWTAAKNSKSKYHDYDPASPDPLNPDPIGFRYDTWTPFNSPHIGPPPFRPLADLDGEDLDEDGNLVDSFNGSPDVLRLKAIQITIRFLDEASGKMRQLTIQHALDNNSNN